MKILYKAFVLIVLIFLMRLTFSCCNCDYQSAVYQFDHVQISNINNSGWTADQTEYNVMYDEAVAFRVKIIDSSFQWIYAAQKWSPGLNQAYAMEPCICPVEMFLKSEISSLSIITLRDFSPDKPAGADLTQSFVFQTGWNHMYHDIDSLVPRLNQPFYNHDMMLEKTIDFFCMDTVMNDSLQLVFQLEYLNGDVLADTTEVIAILTSGEEGRQ